MRAPPAAARPSSTASRSSPGFSLVFVALLRRSSGALGAFLDRQVLNVIGGAILVFLGLQVAGVINVRALWRDTRAMPTMGGGLVMAGGTGAAGGLGRPAGATPRATPAPSSSACCSPPAGARASARSSAGSSAWPPPRPASRQGTVLLIAYAAGLAIPFLAVALGASWVSRRLTWVGRHHHAVSLVTGALLVILGVLMITNMLGRLATLGSPFGL